MVTEYSQKMIDKHQLSFPVLQDPGNRIADQFNLKYTLPEDLRQLYEKFGIDLPRFNGDNSWTLPIPTRYVVTADGEIVSCAISADYRERPEPEETLEFIRGL